MSVSCARRRFSRRSLFALAICLKMQCRHRWLREIFSFDSTVWWCCQNGFFSPRWSRVLVLPLFFPIFLNYFFDVISIYKYRTNIKIKWKRWFFLPEMASDSEKKCIFVHEWFAGWVAINDNGAHLQSSRPAHRCAIRSVCPNNQLHTGHANT